VTRLYNSKLSRSWRRVLMVVCLDGVCRVAIVVQQIMKGPNGALPEEDKIVAMTKIVIKLINVSGH